MDGHPASPVVERLLSHRSDLQVNTHGSDRYLFDGNTCRMLHSIVHDVHFLSQRLSLCGIPRSETRDCYLMYLESTACDNVLLGKIVCSNAELSCLPEFRVDFLNLDYASQVTS